MNMGVLVKLSICRLFCCCFCNPAGGPSCHDACPQVDLVDWWRSDPCARYHVVSVCVLVGGEGRGMK
jgi:hypothetical protein